MRLILEECPYCGAEAALDKRDRRIYIDHDSDCPCAEPFRTYFIVDKYRNVRVTSTEDDIRICPNCARKFYALGRSRGGKYCSDKCQNAVAQHRCREKKKGEQ